MRHDDLYMIIDCVPADPKAPSGHKHNSRLSFELFAGDKSFIIDPGTYIYTADKEMRNLFRSTRYHNTVVVDDKEQNRFEEDQLFAMNLDATVNVNRWLVTENYDLLDAEHNGYSRLNVIHRRQIYFNKKSGYWLIKDTYRINSTSMKKEHWVNDSVEGGGAIIGEGCHFFDFCNWIVGRDPVQIYAEKISSNNESMVDANNVISTIRYEDGSVASIIYTTIGNESFPKERIEIFVDHGVIAIDDFKELIVTGLDGKGEKLKRIEKGPFELINEYGNLLKGGSRNTDLPAVVDGVKATVCSLKVLDALKTGKVQAWDYVLS